MPEQRSTDTIVVGGGQAGIAMSEHLGVAGVPHVVLERHRIAERWRSERWDSLVANGPAWHDRFPGLEFADIAPDAFVPKDQVAAYFEAYARKIRAPIQTGVEVRHAERIPGDCRFAVTTSAGVMTAHRIVAATGAFQRPVVPPLVAEHAGLLQIHSSRYRNPREIPQGAVLVVGSGSSGVQIADELRRAGRPVYLSVSRHDRPPRAYRGRDYDWWLGVLGLWDVEATPGAEHVSISVSGAYGGRTIDFRELAQQGITLLGRARSFSRGTMTFAPDLAENIATGDRNYLSLLDAADAYIALHRLDLPKEPRARCFPPDPDCVTTPRLHLDLAAAGIAAIIWATGYESDFGWLEAPKAFDEHGKPRHRRGVSAEPGVYFLGLPWLTSRASSFIWGVWHDARYIADHIEKQRRYLLYHLASKPLVLPVGSGRADTMGVKERGTHAHADPHVQHAGDLPEPKPR